MIGSQLRKDGKDQEDSALGLVLTNRDRDPQEKETTTIVKEKAIKIHTVVRGTDMATVTVDIEIRAVTTILTDVSESIRAIFCPDAIINFTFFTEKFYTLTGFWGFGVLGFWIFYFENLYF